MFESRLCEWDNVEFLRVSIRTQWKESNLMEGLVSSRSVNRNIFQGSQDTTRRHIRSTRSVRASFAWLAHSWPEVCFAINRASQVMEKNFDNRHILELNRAIHRVRSLPNVRLNHGFIDRRTLYISTYTDSYFATNDDHSSQLGNVILLCDDTDRCHILDYASNNCKRVVTSSMGGETYTFTEGFDCAYATKHTFGKLYRQKIPFTMLTDSKQMFDDVTKASHPLEKGLITYIAAFREAYGRHNISNIGLVLSEHNMADGLTKLNRCSVLEQDMEYGLDQNSVQQWIFRS